MSPKKEYSPEGIYIAMRLFMPLLSNSFLNAVTTPGYGVDQITLSFVSVQFEFFSAFTPAIAASTVFESKSIPTFLSALQMPSTAVSSLEMELVKV